MSFLGELLKLDIGELISKYLISKTKLAEMQHAEIGEEVDLPTVKTKIRGAGYWEIPLGPGRRIR